eukprot:3334365-Rhodomonas_salina.1
MSLRASSISSSVSPKTQNLESTSKNLDCSHWRSPLHAAFLVDRSCFYLCPCFLEVAVHPVDLKTGHNVCVCDADWSFILLVFFVLTNMCQRPVVQTCCALSKTVLKSAVLPLVRDVGGMPGGGR